MKNIGQPVMYFGPEEFGKFLNERFEQFGRLIREFNIKLEQHETLSDPLWEEINLHTNSR